MIAVAYVELVIEFLHISLNTCEVYGCFWVSRLFEVKDRGVKFQFFILFYNFQWIFAISITSLNFLKVDIFSVNYCAVVCHFIVICVICYDTFSVVFTFYMSYSSLNMVAVVYVELSLQFSFTEIFTVTFSKYISCVTHSSERNSSFEF